MIIIDLEGSWISWFYALFMRAACMFQARHKIAFNFNHFPLYFTSYYFFLLFSYLLLFSSLSFLLLLSPIFYFPFSSLVFVVVPSTSRMFLVSYQFNFSAIYLFIFVPTFSSQINMFMYFSRLILTAAAVWRTLCLHSTTDSSLPVLLCFQPSKLFSMKSILNVRNPYNKGLLYYVYGVLESLPVLAPANLHGQVKRETKLRLRVDWCQGRRIEVPYISNSHSSGTVLSSWVVWP